MPNTNQSFAFIDLFAGIGGFHTALTNLGGTCVFSSDWNKYVRETYHANYHMQPEGDIYTIPAETIPDHDVLCAGFPCQPFSLAGLPRKNSLGMPHGLNDPVQGNLFLEIVRVADFHRPPVMFLENVKNLKSHDKGNTWRIIRSAFEQLNYWVFEQIIDAKHWVPQHRERMFIVCFNKEVYPQPPNFGYPHPPPTRLYELVDVIGETAPAKYTLSDKLWEYLQEHKKRAAAKGQGFGYGLIDRETTEYTRTMSARYYKDGSEILVDQTRLGLNPRRITPSEARKLFGYPEQFIIPVSDSQAYKQFGNSVVVPAVQAVAERILPHLPLI